MICHCASCDAPPDPVCSVCNEDGKPMTDIEDTPICEECYEKSLHCQRLGCGGEILINDTCEECGRTAT